MVVTSAGTANAERSIVLGIRNSAKERQLRAQAVEFEEGRRPRRSTETHEPRSPAGGRATYGSL
jgi:hypothetical protein